MPAVARKVSPDSYQNQEVVPARTANGRARAGVAARARLSAKGPAAKTSAVRKPVVKSPAGKRAPARKRWHDEPAVETAPKAAPARSGAARRQRQDEVEGDWRGLIDHFGLREGPQRGWRLLPILIDREVIGSGRKPRPHFLPLWDALAHILPSLQQKQLFFC
jgi:hypothetical protein